MGAIRNLIDYQFNKVKKVQYVNLIIYLSLFVFPFAYQLVIEDYAPYREFQILVCNIVCLITNIYFELIEVFQFLDGKSRISFDQVTKSKGCC